MASNDDAAPNEAILPSSLSSQASETTRDEAFRSLLTNEEHSDLTLRGQDGSLVIANRCILASRSPVFSRMLFGEFAEATERTVDLGFDGAVLQAVVEYMYTDAIPTSVAAKNDKGATDTLDISLARFLVSLADAANYFVLLELRRKVEASADEHMKSNPNDAILFLAACDATNALQASALAMVKAKPEILIHGNKSSLALIQPSQIEEILTQSNGTMIMDELSRFRMINAWAEAAGDDDIIENVDEEDIRGIFPRRSRKRFAAQMTHHLHLEDIAAADLSTTVKSSGLVTEKQLFDAYETLALRMCNKKPRTYWNGKEVVWKPQKRR